MLTCLALAFIVPAGSPSPVPEAARTPAPEVAPSPTPPILDAPLDFGERDTILRLAWQTLVGHLTNRPIQDRDLEAYDLTPRLMAPQGCFVTLKKDGQIRGNQGEIEPTRPLYQQVIVFARRAASRDPRFLPLTDRDLVGATIEVAVIGKRERVESPEAIQVDRQGLFLEKWGRRALFLPGQATGWTPEKALDDLCRQAALPPGAWKQGARVEVFTTDVIAGPRPPPAVSPPAVPVATPAETPASRPEPNGP